MDNSSLSREHKSSWVYVVIVFVVIVFGLFWLIQSKAVPPPTPISVQSIPQKNSPITTTADLEASVSAIEIPDYSEAF